MGKIWDALVARGAGTISVMRVKWHAKEEQVEEGSDRADKAASEGVKEHVSGLQEFIGWIN